MAAQSRWQPILASGVALATGVACAVALRSLRLKARWQPCLPYVPSSKKKALLISNSKLAGLEYLDHVEAHIHEFLGTFAAGDFVLFVPYALKDRDGYAAKARERFKGMGYSLRSLHEYQSVQERLDAARSAKCIFVGGGNTFRLLKCLQSDTGLLPLIRQRVNDGELMYIGSSAGTNVACPTIRTTNDMPIVWPESLAGLCLVPFQVNTHYIDKEREVKHHMGETREVRLTELLEENSIPIVALREGATISLHGESATLLGPARKSSEVTWDGARLLRRAAAGGHMELKPGDSLDLLLAPPSGLSSIDAWVPGMLDTSARASGNPGNFNQG